MIYNYITYGGTGLTPKIVSSLTDITDSKYLYLIPKYDSDGETIKYYTEYLYIANEPEAIGTTEFHLDTCVQKEDVAPLYLHNIELAYQHCGHPYSGDGTCRASFALINNDPDSYAFNYNDGGIDYAAANAPGNNANSYQGYDKQSAYKSNMSIEQAWQLVRLCRALAYDSKLPENSSKIHPCSGLSCTFKTGATEVTRSTNYKIGVKTHNFKLVQDEYRGEQRELEKRLIVIYGFFDNSYILAKDDAYQSVIEISCGECEYDAQTGTDILFSLHSQEEFAAHLKRLHSHATELKDTVDFTHQIVIVEDNVVEINPLTFMTQAEEFSYGD